MSYTKNTWETGNKITAEKLNNIENGIASLDSIYFVIKGVYNYDNGVSVTIDKTFSQIIDAINNDKYPVCFISAKSENNELTVDIHKYDYSYPIVDAGTGEIESLYFTSPITVSWGQNSNIGINKFYITDTDVIEFESESWQSENNGDNVES